ncbi:DUF2878 domain-containing protein [Kaarinaea lacus]
MMINFILFQAGWFACVISAARQQEWLALIALGTVIAIHLLLVKDRISEMQLILIAGITGLLLDSSLIALGVFTPVNNIDYYGIAPLWLVGMWMLFGITINHSLRWLDQRYIFAALLGFVFAPIAYLAGQKLGALTFPPDNSHMISLLIIGACWLLVTPLLLLASRFIYSRDFHRSCS